MKKFVKKEDKHTSSVSEYIKGKWVTRYFYFFCDICGVRHPDETLQDFVKWYNEKRIHHALNYKTPEEVYREKL